MKKAKSTLSSVLLVCLSLIWLSPIYIILVNSFKSRDEMYVNPLGMPVKFSLEYYSGAMEKMNFLRAFGVSLVITIVSVAIIVVLCAMAAWMMARSDGKLSKAIYYTLILTMLIPFQTLMMPLMQEMNSLEKLLGIQIKDTIGGLIFMYIGFGAGMGVFMFYGFVKGSLPRTLEEAAIIDGAGYFARFTKIIIPLCKPILATIAVFGAVTQWNSFMDTVLYMTGNDYRTLQSLLNEYMNQAGFLTKLLQEGGNAAMTAQIGKALNIASIRHTITAVTLIPILAVYPFFQRFFTKGIMIGAVKG